MGVKQYRTEEQFTTICENAVNGNWRDAGRNCVDFGFYAHDLIRHFEAQECPLIEATDIALITELASEIRYKGEID